MRCLTWGALIVLGCSGRVEHTSPSDVAVASERIGSVGLRLQPVAGITLPSLHYTVTQGDPAAPVPPPLVSEGNLPTPGLASNATFGVPLPVGSGYYLSLSGVSAEANDDISCTGSYGPFEVAPNLGTAINLQLICVDNTKGGVLSTVDVETDACPRLIVDFAVAEPTTTDVGRDIRLSASAHDLDNAAEPISYAWSVVDPARTSIGTFLPANAASTTLRCLSNSVGTVIQVAARNHECQKSLRTVISCVDFTCGDGIVDPTIGETCDWAASPIHPADPTCPLDCTKVCGDGNAEGDEECDVLPLDSSACVPPGEPNACHFRRQLCGNGIVEGTEPCDDGGPSRTCSGLCELIVSASCVECEQAGQCFAASDKCLGSTTTPLSAAQTAQCYDVMQCVQQSGCLSGPLGNLGKCYCGTLSTQACSMAPFDLTQPGAPNGPCALLMQQGNPGVTSNSGILGGLLNQTRPAGLAGQRLNCQKNDPVCAPLCGLQ